MKTNPEYLFSEAKAQGNENVWLVGSRRIQSLIGIAMAQRKTNFGPSSLGYFVRLESYQYFVASVSMQPVSIKFEIIRPLFILPLRFKK